MSEYVINILDNNNNIKKYYKEYNEEIEKIILDLDNLKDMFKSLILTNNIDVDTYHTLTKNRCNIQDFINEILSKLDEVYDDCCDNMNEDLEFLDGE